MQKVAAAGRARSWIASQVALARARLRRSFFLQQVVFAPLEPLSHDSPFRIRFVALALILGEPGYFWFWGYVVPQPVEDLWLRLPCAIFAIPLMFRRFHKFLGKRGMDLYWTALCFYSLPYCFFGLFRENGYNDVYMGASVAGIYCLFILTDWRIAVAESVLGVLAVYLTIPPLGPFALPSLAHMGIFAFAYFTASMLAMTDANLRQLRARSALATIGVMAHELRTPLASAGMLVEALQEDLRSSAGAAGIRLQKLSDALGTLNATIDFQISSTKLTGFPTARAITPVAQEVRAAVASMPVGAQTIRDCIEVVVAEDGRVEMPAQLLRQILHNLLSNAVKSIAGCGRAPAYGDIVVLVEADHSHMRMRVVDRGVGVEPEHLPRLFEPFFSTSDMPAHGLGLTMCRNAVMAYGGDIWCTSPAGGGAKFHVLLPRARQ